MTLAIGLRRRTLSRLVVESSVIVLPPLLGGQAESWSALVELAPAFGANWLSLHGNVGRGSLTGVRVGVRVRVRRSGRPARTCESIK